VYQKGEIRKMKKQVIDTPHSHRQASFALADGSQDPNEIIPKEKL
jgi:hypothetical protein